MSKFKSKSFFKIRKDKLNLYNRERGGLKDGFSGDIGYARRNGKVRLYHATLRGFLKNIKKQGLRSIPHPLYDQKGIWLTNNVYDAKAYGLMKQIDAREHSGYYIFTRRK